MIERLELLIDTQKVSKMQAKIDIRADSQVLLRSLIVHAVINLVWKESSRVAARAWLHELESNHGSDYITKVLQKGKKLQAEVKPYEDLVKDRWENKSAYDLLDSRLYPEPLNKKIMELLALIVSKLSFEDANHKILQSFRKRTQNTTSVAERLA